MPGRERYGGGGNTGDGNKEEQNEKRSKKTFSPHGLIVLSSPFAFARRGRDSAAPARRAVRFIFYHASGEMTIAETERIW